MSAPLSQRDALRENDIPSQRFESRAWTLCCAARATTPPYNHNPTMYTGVSACTLLHTVEQSTLFLFPGVPSSGTSVCVERGLSLNGHYCCTMCHNSTHNGAVVHSYNSLSVFSTSALARQSPREPDAEDRCITVIYVSPAAIDVNFSGGMFGALDIHASTAFLIC